MALTSEGRRQSTAAALWQQQQGDAEGAGGGDVEGATTAEAPAVAPAAFRNPDDYVSGRSGALICSAQLCLQLLF